MHHEADFLHALQADPWSQANRLIYADWLEEQGHAAKAEYLRLEHALAGMAATAPEFPLSEKRLRDLRQEVTGHWLQAIRQPYALILEEPWPAAYNLQAALVELAGEDWVQVRGWAAHIPCILQEGDSRPEMEVRLHAYYHVRHPRMTNHPRVVLRPMTSLRYCLRLMQGPRRRKAQWTTQVQALTGLGSKKAVALASSVPCNLKYDLHLPEAQKWQTKLEAMGCQSTLVLQPMREVRLKLCRVLLRHIIPQFLGEVRQRLAEFVPDIRLRMPLEALGSQPDPLGALPLLVKKCVWQEEAEDLKFRLERNAAGLHMAAVAIDDF